MLAQIVQSREATVAMALKWAFACMLSNMSGEVFAPGEAQVAGRILGAEESLPFSLSRIFIAVSLIVRVILIVRLVKIHDIVVIVVVRARCARVVVFCACECWRGQVYVACLRQRLFHARVLREAVGLGCGGVRLRLLVEQTVYIERCHACRQPGLSMYRQVDPIDTIVRAFDMEAGWQEEDVTQERSQPPGLIRVTWTD